MPDAPKNPDRDDEHRRRRQADDSPEDNPDGKDVAEALYGGDPSALDDGNEADDDPDVE